MAKAGSQLERVTGVQLMQGIGHAPSKEFWADAWEQVLKRPAAVVALCWIGVVAFFGLFAPIIASGHPWVVREVDRATAADSARVLGSRLVAGLTWPVATEAITRELSRHSPQLAASAFLPARSPDQPLSAEEVAAVVQKVAASRELDATGGIASVSSPLWDHLTAVDIVLLVLGIVTPAYVLIGSREKRAARFWRCAGAAVVAVGVLGISGIAKARLDSAAIDSARAAAAARSAGVVVAVNPEGPFVRRPIAPLVVAGSAGAAILLVVAIMPFGHLARRLVVAVLGVAIAVTAMNLRWDPGLERFDYGVREARGEIEVTYTLIPWSPFQRDSGLDRRPPGASRLAHRIDDVTSTLPSRGPLTAEQINGLQPGIDDIEDLLPAEREAIKAVVQSAASRTALPNRAELRRLLDEPIAHKFSAGSDAFGSDVLTQLLHACRLAVSIGLVSTGVALLIGVTMGALMGYFGGWIDLILYRVVEVFMAVPVLFLLIVATAVLPNELRTTYVMMAIIGCFSWTGMARFTRAEFLKLRNQDFVQSAQAMGLPLRSILFKHMLPNGVAPVLVDTSFAVAAAIGVEAVLSYLGLGPVDSASWGRLLSSAISSEGQFKWWLAVYPGVAIFLTVLSYNLLGEAMRDAIDPKLKKARV